MHAVRIEDGQTVAIKHITISSHPHESEIALYLSSPPLSNDPRNHCCPVIDVLEDPLDNDQRLIVMPLLRMYDDPKFTTVGEAVEFFRQAFEVTMLVLSYNYSRVLILASKGLHFMHEHHLAHRYASALATGSGTQY